MPASLKDKSVPMSFILGLDKFSLERAKEIEPGFLTQTRDTVHDVGISSCGFRIKGNLGMLAINTVFDRLMTEQGEDLMRYKGIISIQGDEQKFIFQGIHMLFDGTSGAKWGKKEERISELVFIGRNIDGPALEKEFRDCLVVKGKARFKVGTLVEARMEDGYLPGKIVAVWAGNSPYIIELEPQEGETESMCVFAPEDHDACVRLRAKKDGAKKRLK